MLDIKKRLNDVGMELPSILIPNKDINLEKWAVVACDQFTSEKDYWEEVSKITENSPSTLQLIFPECYLEDNDSEQRIENINKHMYQYLQNDVFKSYENTFFLVHRRTQQGISRWGLITALDLEQYNYSKDSKSIIRATEGTILDRIPPRKMIRKDAPLELPHILVLIDDANRTIIEPLKQKIDTYDKVYDFELMKDGGHVTAYSISRNEDVMNIVTGIEKLSNPLEFEKKYGTQDVIVYAMGDGNHSLATAKSCWEDLKKELPEDSWDSHPARYALVEIENIFDEGLIFEPIHRVLFNTNVVQFTKVLTEFASIVSEKNFDSIDELYQEIHKSSPNQLFGLIHNQGMKLIEVTSKTSSIIAGTIQSVLDVYKDNYPEANIDYIHGLTTTQKLGQQDDNVGIILPAIDKNEFFKSIALDGALPRKTFSMGEAEEKRYYIECRKIK